jgi:hypothetical protein
MSLWKRSRRRDVESELRAARPEPPSMLLSAIEGKIQRSATTTRRFGPRIAVALTLTAGLLAAVASVGGVSSAARGVQHVARSVTGLTGKHEPRAADRTSAGHQYGHTIRVCHHGRVIEISVSALPAHLAHGDSIVPQTSPIGSPCHVH